MSYFDGFNKPNDTFWNYRELWNNNIESKGDEQIKQVLLEREEGDKHMTVSSYKYLIFKTLLKLPN